MDADACAFARQHEVRLVFERLEARRRNWLETCVGRCGTAADCCVELGPLLGVALALQRQIVESHWRLAKCITVLAAAHLVRTRRPIHIVQGSLIHEQGVKFLVLDPLLRGNHGSAVRLLLKPLAHYSIVTLADAGWRAVQAELAHQFILRHQDAIETFTGDLAHVVLVRRDSDDLRSSRHRRLVLQHGAHKLGTDRAAEVVRRTVYTILFGTHGLNVSDVAHGT